MEPVDSSPQIVQPQTILEHENALLQWALSVPTNQLLQHIKLGNLGEFEYALVQAGLTYIDGLRSQEKIEGLDLTPAKQEAMEIVLDHAILSVGKDGFGFKMARSQFAETKQTYSYDDKRDNEGKGGLFDNIQVPNIPKPNPKHYGVKLNK